MKSNFTHYRSHHVRTELKMAPVMPAHLSPGHAHTIHLSWVWVEPMTYGSSDFTLWIDYTGSSILLAGASHDLSLVVICPSENPHRWGAEAASGRQPARNGGPPVQLPTRKGWQQTCELESRSISSQVFRRDSLTLADALMTASQESLKQRPQLSCALIPWPTEARDSTCVGFSFYLCGSFLCGGDGELIYHQAPNKSQDW